jgi:hypothetical protein
MHPFTSKRNTEVYNCITTFSFLLSLFRCYTLSDRGRLQLTNWVGIHGRQHFNRFYFHVEQSVDLEHRRYSMYILCVLANSLHFRNTFLGLLLGWTNVLVSHEVTFSWIPPPLAVAAYDDVRRDTEIFKFLLRLSPLPTCIFRRRLYGSGSTAIATVAYNLNYALKDAEQVSLLYQLLRKSLGAVTITSAKTSSRLPWGTARRLREQDLFRRLRPQGPRSAP